MKEADKIESWKLFLDLKRLGSIRKTSELYGCDPAEISRRFSKLEKELKIPLLDRHSRPFRLTEAGMEIFSLASDLVERHREILEKLEKRADKDSAVIRIMVPSTFNKVSHSIFFEYSKFYPNHRIRVISPVDTEGFRHGEADIAAFTGNVTLPEAYLVPRGRMIFVPVASPDFIRKYGPIHHPNRLSEIPVGYTFGGDPNSHTPIHFLIKGEERLPVHLHQNIEWRTPTMVYEAVLAGECMSPGLPLFFCIDALRNGRLVPVLEGWHRPSQFNYLACHTSRWNVPYIRTFMNWFAEKFAEKEASYEKEFEDLFGKELLRELMTA